MLPCGTYEGIPHDASINGQCMLPDGEVRCLAHASPPYSPSSDKKIGLQVFGHH